MGIDIHNPRVNGRIYLNEVEIKESTIGIIANFPVDIGFSVQAPSGTTQQVTVDVRDSEGISVPAIFKLFVYMCTDEDGFNPSNSGVGDDVTTPIAGNIITEFNSNLSWLINTNGGGRAVLLFDNAGGAGVYTDRIAVRIPIGNSVQVSDPLAIPNT